MHRWCTLVSGHDVVQTMYSHQVTVTTLYQLRNETYLKRPEHESALTFDDWNSAMEQKSPTYQFWSNIIKVELILLNFLCSIRAGNFHLYLYSKEKMITMVLDHYNYARWLSIHLADMKMLEKVYQAFSEFGCFVASRTKNPFSAMGLDQRHEQHNKDVKGDGGLLGLTKDEEKLQQWMVCGPEIACAVAWNLRVHQYFERKKEQNFATMSKHLRSKKDFWSTLPTPRILWRRSCTD